MMFRKNRFGHFMQNVSNRGNLHEMSNPVFWQKIRKNINLSSTEFAQRVVTVILLLLLLNLNHVTNHYIRPFSTE